jgi:hypothetical protein
MCRGMMFVLASALAPLPAGDAPEGLLDRIRARVTENLRRLPDYTCLQTVERFGRFTAEKPWEKIDTLRLEVGMSGKREIYSWHGEKEFDDRQLGDLVGRGTVGTGHFGLLVRHVFHPGAATFAYRGETELGQRIVHEFSFDVDQKKSGYRLRAGAGEAVVGFQGSFLADTETLDLLKLEVQAYDMPRELAMAQADNMMQFRRIQIGNGDFLLPVSAEMLTVTTDGHENLNRIRLSECRQYQADSKLVFAGAETDPTAVAPSSPARSVLPARALLELTLDEQIDPDKAAVGDQVRAVLVRSLKEGEQVLIPQGTAVLGRLVRLDKQSIPFPLYEVGISFHALEVGDQRLPFIATMEEAGPATGLLRQQKTLDPTFTKKRNARMDVLVRETRKGQGVLLWQAKREVIPRGLKMKWRVEE